MPHLFKGAREGDRKRGSRDAKVQRTGDSLDVWRRLLHLLSR